MEKEEPLTHTKPEYKKQEDEESKIIWQMKKGQKRRSPNSHHLTAELLENKTDKRYDLGPGERQEERGEGRIEDYITDRRERDGEEDERKGLT